MNILSGSCTVTVILICGHLFTLITYSREIYTLLVLFVRIFFRSVDHVGCLTAVRMTAVAKLNRYFRRLIRFRQMDFEFALWQMIYLLIKPQKVYRNFMYRKRSFPVFL